MWKPGYRRAADSQGLRTPSDLIPGSGSPDLPRGSAAWDGLRQAAEPLQNSKGQDFMGRV